jgi:hypothetical protein
MHDLGRAVRPPSALVTIAVDRALQVAIDERHCACQRAGEPSAFRLRGVSLPACQPVRRREGRGKYYATQGISPSIGKTTKRGVPKGIRSELPAGFPRSVAIWPSRGVARGLSMAETSIPSTSVQLARFVPLDSGADRPVLFAIGMRFTGLRVE